MAVIRTRELSIEENAVHSAWNKLAQTVLVENVRTVEDLVREMLKPMLTSWLDDKLPTLVERLVLLEIGSLVASCQSISGAIQTLYLDDEWPRPAASCSHTPDPGMKHFTGLLPPPPHAREKKAFVVKYARCGALTVQPLGLACSTHSKADIDGLFSDPS
jgi:hypothetical protein